MSLVLGSSYRSTVARSSLSFVGSARPRLRSDSRIALFTRWGRRRRPRTGPTRRPTILADLLVQRRTVAPEVRVRAREPEEVRVRRRAEDAADPGPERLGVCRGSPPPLRWGAGGVRGEPPP